MSRILVVDDQQTVVYSLNRLLRIAGYEVITAADGREAIEIANSRTPDLVIMDVRMPGLDGLAALAQIKKEQPRIQVIMMTAYSTIDKAIEATKLGAFDYLAKPFDNEELLSRVRDALKSKELVAKTVFFDEIEEDEAERVIGKSPQMLAVYKQVGKVAPTVATVLIKGESGTGKELVARAIFHHSDRSAKPFLAMNCAAIPEQLMESELFGYERGAFTGANFRRIGKFEQCIGGAILLDEIGDMPIGLQAKLLRVLQDGGFERLGGSETITTDVRIIAATNKNLEEMVKVGTFREDLYYRLNVVCIELPPLRERLEDLDDLTAYFIGRFNKKFTKNIKGITAEALNRLRNYSWPGNVRELANTIQKAVVFCSSEYLTPECCENPGVKANKQCAPIEKAMQQLVALIFTYGCQGHFQETIRMFEKEMVKKAMELTDGNQVQSARLLGISRNTLRKKLEEEDRDFSAREVPD
jgi:nitrogen regulation protein NR(I)